MYIYNKIWGIPDNQKEMKWGWKDSRLLENGREERMNSHVHVLWLALILLSETMMVKIQKRMKNKDIYFCPFVCVLGRFCSHLHIYIHFLYSLLFPTPQNIPIVLYIMHVCLCIKFKYGMYIVNCYLLASLF